MYTDGKSNSHLPERCSRRQLDERLYSFPTVPLSLQAEEIDPNLHFDLLRQSPDSCQGRVVVGGGEVLSVKRTATGARTTIVGQVTPAITMPRDEIGHTSPTVAVKNIKVCPGRDASPRGYRPSYWGP